MEDIISWIQSWRDKYCDRDWETENGFDIKTASNPGWVVEIDLAETSLEGTSYDSGLVEKSSEHLD